MWWNPPRSRAKVPSSSRDFWVPRCWKTAFCIMGNVMKHPIISFVNLFSPFLFLPQAHCWNPPVIQDDSERLLSRLSSSLAGGALAGSQRPSCSSYGSDETWFWEIGEIWIINGRLARDNVCSGSVQQEKEIHTCVLGRTCVFKRHRFVLCSFA